MIEIGGEREYPPWVETGKSESDDAAAVQAGSVRRNGGKPGGRVGAVIAADIQKSERAKTAGRGIESQAGRRQINGDLLQLQANRAGIIRKIPGTVEAGKSY